MRSRSRACIQSLATCIGLATVLGILANVLLVPEGDPWLSNKIAICVWGVSIAASIWNYNRLTGQKVESKGSHLRFQFSALTLFIVVTAVAMGVWTGIEYRHSRERFALLNDLFDRGGNAYPVQLLIAPFPSTTEIRLVLPGGRFTNDEIAKLRLAFPGATITVDE